MFPACCYLRSLQIASLHPYIIIVSVPKKKTFTYHHGSEKFPNYQKYNTNADNTTNHSKNYQQDIWTFGAIWTKTQK